MAPSGNDAPRPRRAAASRASSNIAAQYENPFADDSPQSLPPRRQVRRGNKKGKDLDNGDIDSVLPSTKPHGDNELLPEETKQDEYAGFFAESSFRLGTQTPRRSLRHIPVLKTPLSQPRQTHSLSSVAPLPTPSTQRSLKRKYLADVGASPSIASVAGPSAAPIDPWGPPPSRKQKTLASRFRKLESTVGRYESKFREMLQGQPEMAPGPSSTLAHMDESDGDPFAFVYEKLDLQTGRNYQVEIVEGPDRGTTMPRTWELRGTQEQDTRIFLRLKRAGFTHDEATAICRKGVPR
ncbi:hypothetical protein QQZ08_005266 [Neonectria magnoliae]|uniref:Uncharacterized protein n=1 Tax=Neonectria magnoliae TaxID=2732573 RepID=A0ABR1I3Z9_9HYPO